MNHLQKAKEGMKAIYSGNISDDIELIHINALIAIAEQLEKMNNITEGEQQAKAGAKPQESK